MKAIIGEKLYDTEKSKLLFSFIRNFPIVGKIFGIDYTHSCWRDVDLYVTKKQNYFIHVKQANYDKNSSVSFGKLKEYLEEISKKEAKRIVQTLDPDKAIELFGQVEEA